MNHNENVENTAARPLARLLARELSHEEVTMVAAGCTTSGGNSADCTTDGGGGVQDRDHIK